MRAEAKVDCGGKQALTASGSTSQTQRDDEVHRRVSTKPAPPQTLSYTANASVNGIADFLAGKTDFSGSDTPLSGDQYVAAKQRCGGADAWNLPVVFSPLAITYNLAAVDSLVLDAPMLAKIFNGTITRWDDPAFSPLNASMPSEEIHVIYRSDESINSYDFQDYLQAASDGAWNKGRGPDFQRRRRHRRHRQHRHLGGCEEPPRARSATTHCPSRSHKAFSPPRSRRRQAVGRCAP